MPSKKSVSRQPSVRPFESGAFVPLLATQPRQKEIDVPCGTGNAVESQNKPAANVSVNVTNTGDCDVNVELTAAGVARGNVPIPAGESGSIATSGVDRVTIDCQRGHGEHPRCKFSYSVTWS